VGPWDTIAAMAYEWKSPGPEDRGRGARWIRLLIVAVVGLAIALILIGLLSAGFTFLIQAPGATTPP
jgi:hypothetical protein